MNIAQKVPGGFPGILSVGVLLVCLFSLFGSCLWNSAVIPWAADHGMPPHRAVVEAIRDGGGFFWDSTYYLGNGRPNGALLYPHWPFMTILPMSLSFTVNIALHLFWAGMGAWFCARKLGVGRWGAALGGVAFGLATHTISLLYPGHIAKMQAIVWIPWTIGFFWEGWHSGRVRDFLLCSMCFAPAMQSGEPQIPLYLGFYLPTVALVGLLSLKTRQRKRRIAESALRLGLSVLCAALTLVLAFQAVSTYSGWLGGVRPGTISERISGENGAPPASQNKAKWDFATGWSFPPEDTLTFLLTGQIFGGRSPGYFGRMGTDTMRLKETDDYVGVLVVFLALLALGGLRRNRAIVFLLFVLLSSLFVGYGRYTPIYRVIFSLPTMASQRVPARWIAFTAFAFAILAGFGLDRFLAICRDGSSGQRKRHLALPVIMAGTALLLFVIQLALGIGSNDFVQKAFGVDGFIANSSTPNLSQLRADRFLQAFRTTETLLLLGAGILLLGLLNRLVVRSESGQQKLITTVALLAVLLTGVDLTLNAKHFVEPYNWKQYHQADGLVQFIQKDADLARTQPIGTHRHPVLNRIVGPVGSWNRLRLTEQTSMNVLPTDIAQVHATLRTAELDHRFNPRYYDLFNVKYVLSAFEFPSEILKQTQLKLRHRVPYGGNISPLFLYEYTGFTPNPTFVSSTKIVETEEELLALISSEAFDPSRSVAGLDLPPIDSGRSGQATLTEFGDSAIEIRVNADGEGWVVLKEHYDKHWKATVDANETQVYRLNLLHFGVPVKAGRHEVRFSYSPPRTKFIVVSAAWGAAVLGVCLTLLKRRPLG